MLAADAESITLPTMRRRPYLGFIAGRLVRRSVSDRRSSGGVRDAQQRGRRRHHAGTVHFRRQRLRPRPQLTGITSRTLHRLQSFAAVFLLVCSLTYDGRHENVLTLIIFAACQH